MSRAHFDVVMLSDLSLPGGTTASNIQEIAALARAGMTVGLAHNRLPRRKRITDVNPKFEAVVDGSQVRHLSAREPVTCDLLVIRHPGSAEVLRADLPRIEAGNVAVVVNQTPRLAYDVASAQHYDLEKIAETLAARFGEPITWHPIGPRVRQALVAHHAGELDPGRIAPTDWVNVIDLGAWRRFGRRQPDGVVRVGRHSRDAVDKWPENAVLFEEAYPSTAPFQVRVLGGASAVQRLRGAVPDNWLVFPFDALSPRAFLHSLDVYVYLTATGMVEAFGRAILEALAAGVPVVTSPAFRELFGDACVYAEPGEVRTRILELAGDDALYERQVGAAGTVVAQRFDHATHVRRVRALMEHSHNHGEAAR
jgi:glycosyltransferase involved in cell wall biosynthesis